MVRVAVCCTGMLESVTVMLNELVPGAVGVPLITPVEGAIDNPAGSPLAEKVNGGVPPVVVTVTPGYATPTVPFGSDGGVICNAGGAITIDRLALAVRWVGLVESVTVITPELVPAGPVGVPAIWPVALIESPAGKPVAVKV